MLSQLMVKGFKSLSEVDVVFPRLTVLFGPNAAGKSNLLEAVQALSRIGTSDTLSEALSKPIRGYPVEAFAFPSEGLAGLLNRKIARFSLKAKLHVPKAQSTTPYWYRVAVAIRPTSGRLTIKDESLVVMASTGKPHGLPLIEKKNGQFLVRRRIRDDKAREVDGELDYALLSAERFGSTNYPGIARCRQELNDWRIYYLDPRTAMRRACPPEDVRDIGMLGETISPFLYRLSQIQPKLFATVKRTLRSLVPSVEDLAVDLDKRRGTLDIQISQNGTQFSSRIVSEGILRVLALCAIAVNPWTGSLIGFEEPENGVHPRRLELIAQLLTSLAIGQKRQIIVTTHSAIFCDAILKEARRYPNDIALLNVRRGANGTVVEPFDILGPSVTDRAIAEAFTAPSEDGLFEGLLLRGLLDE